MQPLSTPSHAIGLIEPIRCFHAIGLIYTIGLMQPLVFDASAGLMQPFHSALRILAIAVRSNATTCCNGQRLGELGNELKLLRADATDYDGDEDEANDDDEDEDAYEDEDEVEDEDEYEYGDED